MSLIPAFEIGLWNAWILTVVDALTIPIFLRIVKNRQSPSPEKAMAGMSRVEQIILYASKVMFVPVLIYSIFVPLKLGTMWFYAGLAIFLIGLAVLTAATVNFATTAMDVPITKGIYHYSRHPLYLASLLIYFSVGIASASWVFLSFFVVQSVFIRIAAVGEERYCLDKYGDAYREYMNRTPRWIGISKSVAK
jgi:protein-S-isoprenylcysteine O-methyltransferase Ste14